ncbi:MAG: Spy/CpxP family protein refolding chaperone [Syntrophales bacterium]
MKKLMTVMAVIALAAIVVTSPAEARRGWGGGYPGGGYYDLAAAPGLNLTAEQAEAQRSLREIHLREVKPLQDQMFSKSSELRLLWLERTPDQKKILVVQKEVRSLRDQLTDRQTSYRLEAPKILTPEQQARLQINGRGLGYGRGHGWGPGGRMGY